MAKSLPSKKIAIVDAPEVKNFRAKFDYNFFTKDEKVNDSGQIAPKSLLKRPSDEFNDSFVESRNFQAKVPRLVKFDWQPVIESRDYIAQRVSVSDNFTKIHNEQNFVLNDFTNLDIQDTSVDQRLSFFIRRALEEVQKGYAPPRMPESPLDVAKTLNKLSPESIRGSFLASILVNLSELGVKFVTKQNREAIAKTLTSQIQKTKSRLVVNNRVAKKILLSTTESPTSIFEDEAETLIAKAEEIQRRAVDEETSSFLTDREFDLEIVEYIGIRNIDSPSSFDSTVQPVGYIIDKQELMPNGSLIDHTSIVVENPLASTTVDLRIKYGSTYFYKIRSVVFVEVQAQDFESDNIVAVSFLVCSQHSDIRQVVCTEDVPPPAPWDFNIAWDYQNTAARITWSFPTNSQRDIKYFQLFRRKTINEPFELIKQYDFDDSQIRTPWTETPDTTLIESLTSPKTYYLDKEFGKNSTFIYALCSVDAHGLSSNYSMQLEVSFDRFKNKILKKLISVAGAPKAYPNMYLNQDTFVDTIKDSGHSEVQVIFNPEYLEIFDSSANNLKLIKTSGDSMYKLSIINVDLQKQQSVDIRISDRRTPADETNLENLVEIF